jgi:formylglycine-generating enzyme required for sulfatase activity
MKKRKLLFLSAGLLLIVSATVLVFAACASSSVKTDSARAVSKWGPDLVPEMVWVPGGSFRMGSEDPIDLDARPVHTVTLDGFYMAKYLITQAQYQAVTGYNPSWFQGYTTGESLKNDPLSAFRADLPQGLETGAMLPVERVTWYDAAEFCNKLSELEGLTPVYSIRNRKPAEGYPISAADVTADWNASGYRLPTEAEWEYAAKGGNGMGPYFVFSGSNDPDKVAWYAKNPKKRLEHATQMIADGTLPEHWIKIGHNVADEAYTHPVGEKEPNGLGIYDLSGNVWEWCWDWFDYYAAAPQANPKGPSSGASRVRRGGTYSYVGESIVRVAYRDYYFPFDMAGIQGFRVVRK